MTGAGQTIAGATTFNNLTKTVSTADTLTFAAGSTQTVNGTLTLNGTAGNLLKLRSTAAGSQWSIKNVGGTAAVSFVDVQDSNAGGSNSITDTNAVNSNNNVNWLFPGLVPMVTSISPTSGAVGGGTVVTIIGTNFSGATGVQFGAASASSFTVNSATQITCTSPAGSTGTVDITVITSSGTSVASAGDKFFFFPPLIITSGPTATPNPAFVLQAMQFSSAATSSGTLTFAWDFGDGTFGAGSSVSHAYTVAGTFTVKVTVTDTFGQSAAATVVTTALALNPVADSNSDGYPNEVALALGSNPSTVGQTPLGAPPVTSNAAATIKKLKINLKFAQRNSDQIQIMGTLPGVSNVAAGAVLIFDIGHVVNGFTINKLGKGIGSAGANGRLNDNCQIRTARGGATFTAKLMAGAYQTALTSEPDPLFDLTAVQGASKTRTVNVTVYLNSVAYKAQVTSVYVARKGQFGK